MYEIPTSILIEGKEFNIRNKGDYRTILDCLVAMGDSELSTEERVASSLIIFYEDINSLEDLQNFPNKETAVLEMFKFFNCGQLESPGASVNYKLIDWEQDSQLISSAINKVANKEIRLEPYLHWWTFMGYYLAVGESALATVLNIRNKLKQGKKLEKHELEFKRNNPGYFNWDSRTVQQHDSDELARQLWNSGK